MTTQTAQERPAIRRQRLAEEMVLLLPGFGRWAGTMRDFETPYGKAGIRQLEVLYILRHDLIQSSRQTATLLADYFHIQRSVVTRVLAKLEQGGFIVRTIDPHDHRAQQISITERGRQLSDYVEQKYFEEMDAALGEINEHDLDCLERSMEILTRAAMNLGLGDTVNRRLDSHSSD